MEVAPCLRHLYSYLFENGFIQPIRDFDASQLNVVPEDVLALIEAGDPAWEQMVPAEAVGVIRRGEIVWVQMSKRQATEIAFAPTS